MEKNKRGISTIIATLILVLLTIVLIGVVWIVVNNIVTNSTKQISSGAQCLNSAVQVTSAVCSMDGTDCNVTVQRTLGTDAIGGVRLVFINATSGSNVWDINGSVTTLQSITGSDINAGVANTTEIDAAVYYTDSAGNKSPCSGAEKYTTVQLV